MADRSKSKSAIALVGAAAALVFVSTIAFCQATRWTLPVADGGPKPSPPSVHGYLVAAGKQRLTVKRDTLDGGVGATANVQLTSKTEFFTAYGGYVAPDELLPGQYVWVWYITADAAKAGKPPRAAVVMLWSTSRSEEPPLRERWSFDKKK
jgi:hypothetical protein